jgi:hypothetical protein
MPDGAEYSQDSYFHKARGTTFENAKFYDCRDSETLSYQTPEESLHDYFETYYEPGQTLRETIIDRAPVTVTAYDPEDGPSDKWILARIECALEDLEECYSENWGPPDDPAWEKDKANELRDKLLPVVRDWLKGVNVWQCKKVGTREYSEEELLEIFKDDIEDEDPTPQSVRKA